MPTYKRGEEQENDCRTQHFLLKNFYYFHFICNFAPDSISPNGDAGQNLVVKGRLRNVIFYVQISQINASEDIATGTSTLVVLCTDCIVVSLNISRRGLSRVAYPDARQCESPYVG